MKLATCQIVCLITSAHSEQTLLHCTVHTQSPSPIKCHLQQQNCSLYVLFLWGLKSNPQSCLGLFGLFLHYLLSLKLYFNKKKLYITAPNPPTPPAVCILILCLHHIIIFWKSIKFEVSSSLKKLRAFSDILNPELCPSLYVRALINSPLYYLDDILLYGTMVFSNELHNELISILAALMKRHSGSI